MKNISNNKETMRNMNGGGLGVSVLVAMGVIGGACEACKLAWDTGTWLGNQIVSRRKK